MKLKCKLSNGAVGSVCRKILCAPCSNVSPSYAIRISRVESYGRSSKWNTTWDGTSSAVAWNMNSSTWKLLFIQEKNTRNLRKVGSLALPLPHGLGFDILPFTSNVRRNAELGLRTAVMKNILYHLIDALTFYTLKSIRRPKTSPAI